LATIDLATYAYNLELDDKSFTSGMNNAEGKTEKFKSKMGGFSKFLKTSVVAGIAGVGLAAGAMVTKGVMATAQLDELMSQFKASTGSTAEETEKLKDLTQELYKSNTDSYEDIVATTEALKKSLGLSVGEIEKYQQSYMDFAKTTGQANDEVVKDVAKISKAWDLTAEESAKSLDMLKLSSEKFGTDIVSIQKSLQETAPAAKALGLSFEETNGMLNLFSQAGLKSEQAVTAFNFAAKTVESPEEFKQLLSDIQSIEDPTKRAQKAVETFGSRAGVSLANALDGSKNLDELMVSMDEAAGTVSNASAAFDDNFNVQLELTKKLFGGLVQELGEKFMPAVNSMLTWVNDNVPVIVSVFEQSFEIIGNVINPFIDLIKEVVSNFDFMKVSSDETFIEMKNLITSVLGDIQEYIQAYISVILKFWEKYGDDIISFTQKAFDSIVNILKNVFEIISGIFQTVTGLLTGDWEKFGNGLVKVFQGAWDLIENVFQLAVDSLEFILNLAASLLLDLGKHMGKMLWDGLKQLWESTIKWLEGSMSSLFKWFGGLDSTFKNIGKDMFSSVWDGLKGVWSSISKWVSDKISWLTDKLAFWRNSNNEMSSSSSTSGSLGIGDLPQYSQGTPFVPTDGLAYLHKGEMVVPAQYNPMNNSNQLKSASATNNTIHFNPTFNLDIKGISSREEKRRLAEDITEDIMEVMVHKFKPYGFVM
jgi:hypothetical protein